MVFCFRFTMPTVLVSSAEIPKGCSLDSPSHDKPFRLQPLKGGVELREVGAADLPPDAQTGDPIPSREGIDDSCFRGRQHLALSSLGVANKE